MTTSIRALETGDIDTVVEFSLRAWRPVFESFAQVLGSRIHQRLYPDWLTSQAKAVEDTCRDPDAHVWVAQDDGRPVGFVAVVYHDNPRRGEIDMLAVDPDHQRGGLGVALTSYAVDRIGEAGAVLVEIGTGGDPGHAPARRTYEKAGFTALPLVRYYKAL
ncbi:MAG: GNAT family N-acetyltransferase [Actinocatenispora sp.]